MRNRVLTCVLTAATAVGIGQLLTPGAVVGQSAKAAAPEQTKAGSWTPPKTPWGDPDLQGIFTSDDYIGVSMARPANAAANAQFMMTEAEIAQREARIKTTAQGDLQEFAGPNARASTGPPSHWIERAKRAPKQNWMVVDPPDGRIPAVLAEARNRRQGYGANNNDPRPDTWEDFSYYIRCITRGVTGSVFPVIYGNGTEIVQGPGYVAIMQEMVHEARIIPLNGGPHVSDSIRSYMGDPRGRFDGNTLVVETTNFLPGKTGMGANGGGVPTSEALKLTERFTRIDADTIKYEVTIDDPKTYAGSWTVSFPIYAEQGYQLFEYACHEGNYAMTNSLSAARAQDKADAEAAAKK